MASSNSSSVSWMTASTRLTPPKNTVAISSRSNPVSSAVATFALYSREVG